jgi:type I restriction enzyme M protein
VKSVVVFPSCKRICWQSTVTEIKERGYKLDITWLKDDSLENRDELPEPQDLASEAITELEAVVDDLREIVALVEKEEGIEK